MAIIGLSFGITPQGVVVMLMSMLFIKSFITVVYRLTIHPLAKYPGPFLAKITDFYGAYHGWQQNSHVDAWMCHETYGNFVRYGPNKLLVNSSRGYQGRRLLRFVNAFNKNSQSSDIYNQSSNVKKAKSYLPMVPSKGAWSILTAIDKDMHRHKRNLSSRALSDKAVRDFEPAMIVYVDLFTEQLTENLDSSQWSSPKNMIDFCKKLTTDIMGDFGFGQKLGMMNDPSLSFVLDTLQSYSWRMGIYDQYPQLTVLHLETLTSLLSSRTKLGKKWRRWSNDISSTILDRTNGRSKGRFSVILDSKDPKTGKTPPEPELWADGSFMMLAGSDTSAITMCATFFYVTHNPEAYARLVAEIRDTFPCIDDVRSGALMDSCVYLSACIDGSMRMSPPTPRAPLREVKKGGVEVDGEYIPEGLDVGTCIYSIQHNKQYFFDPFVFNPDRWFPGQIVSQEYIDRAREAMNPFSVGPRSCTGRSLALLQIRLVIARVVWLYDFKRAEGIDSHVGESRVEHPNGRYSATEYGLRAHVSAACDGPVLVFRSKDK